MLCQRRMLDLSNALDQERNSENEHADGFQSRETFSLCFHVTLGPICTGPGKFLHGRILFLDRLFTWIRASSVAVVFTGIRVKFRPVAAFDSRSLPRYLSKTLHGSGVYTSPSEIWNRASQKVDLLFSGPKLAHLAVHKSVQFRRSLVNARWNRASFCPCKYLSGPV